MGIHYNKDGGAEVLDYVKNKDALSIQDGYIALPTAHGLGIEIDEDIVKEKSIQPHEWRNNVWYNADGSIAEW